MNRFGFILGLGIIITGGLFIFFIVPPPKTPIEMSTVSGGTDATPATSTFTGADTASLIAVSAPLPGAAVSSTTLVASGQARGNWYFEASFPVVLTDWDGRIIAQSPARALSDWMTEGFVPFSVVLNYPPQPSGSRGFLILKNDNPSGDPGRDKSVEIPVIFK